MPKSKARVKLEKKVLKHFQNKYGEERFSSPEDVRIFHYARNDKQSPVVDYAQIILGDYSLVSDAKSAFHRFGTGNENNSKWLGPKGRQEYVFKFDAKADEFVLVTDPVNMGSYNFIRSDNPAYHLLHQRFDINPWILWGNSASDPTTFQERQAAYNDAVSPEGAVLFFQDALGLRPKQKGGGGDDRFFARAEAEIFVGKGGNDTVSYAVSDSAITVNLEKATPFAKIAGFDGYARGDKLLSIENLVGSEFGDILVGNKKSNILEGAGGNDQIFLLHAKEDTVLGGDGDDIITIKKGKQHSIDGGEGYDILDLRGVKLKTVNFDKITNIEEVWTDDMGVSETLCMGLGPCG